MVNGLGTNRRPIVERGGLVRRFINEDDGQDVIEYALITALIGVVGILTLRGIQTAVGTTYSSWMNPAAGTPSIWEPPEPPAP